MIKEKDITIGIVIQARTGSSRLPNKILMNFYDSKSILDILIEKLKSNFSNYPIILASSTNSNDNILSEFAVKHNIEFYQGSEENVLSRFVEVGSNKKLTHLLRICSDNPFLNMDSISNLIKELDNPKIDYISYCNYLGIPVIKTHIGLFTEIVSLKALLKASDLQNEPIYQEHVTNFIYANPQLFNVKLLNSPSKVYSREDIRLTLDDKEDFDNLASLYKITNGNQDNISFLIDFIDSNEKYKVKMINNIQKYSK
jgi:spore coat polysaccharide biosynthesis protein SpsF